MYWGSTNMPTAQSVTLSKAKTRTPVSKPAPLPAGLEVGAYRIVRHLATGGFGLVYLAQSANGKQVAIKEYLPRSLATRSKGSLQPKILHDKHSLYRLGLRSFFEEGRSLAQLAHGGVVNVLDFFAANETVYLVMDYLEGATLQEYVVLARSSGRSKTQWAGLREATIYSIFDEVLSGLRVVHQHKMLHLDIKLGNIFMTEDDRAVLIDFGAARQVLGFEGNYLRPMYTPGFAAPELYQRGASLGPWTDIYAIGACLYSCMLGRTAPDALARDKQDTLPALLQKAEGRYTHYLIDLVKQCMALEPSARIASVQLLQKMLQVQAPDGEPSKSILHQIKYQITHRLHAMVQGWQGTRP